MVDDSPQINDMRDDHSGTGGLSDWQRRQLRQMLDSWTASNFDPYVVLGLQRPASPEQITRAHRRLVMEYHPDRHFNDSVALELLKRINVARDTLNWSIQINEDANSDSATSYGGVGHRYRREQRDPREAGFRDQGRHWQQSNQRRDQSNGDRSEPPKDDSDSRSITDSKNFHKTMFWIAIGAAVTMLIVLWMILETDSSDPTASNADNPSDSETSDGQFTSSDVTARSAVSTASTLTPEPTLGSDDSDIDQWRQYTLKIINQARQEAGLQTLTLVDNPVSQQHAEDMKENCFVSPWGTDGMKPYMRYTLSGGQQHSSEITYGANYCPTFGFLYEQEPIEQQIEDVITSSIADGASDSSVLDPYVHEVAIGLAHSEPTLWVVLTFVGNSIDYDIVPFIHNYELQFKASAETGVDFATDDLNVAVYYDELPKPLRPGQLHQTHCYWHGELVAILRKPPPAGQYYVDDTFSLPSERCVDPYDVPADAPEVGSFEDIRSSEPVQIIDEGIRVTADIWEVARGGFHLKADIGTLLSLFGDGVYTVVLYATVDGEFAPISEYSIFVPARTVN